MLVSLPLGDCRFVLANKSGENLGKVYSMVMNIDSEC
jgi:hypothetical protein